MEKRKFTYYLLVYGLSFVVMLMLMIFSYTRINNETGEYGYFVSNSINVSGSMAEEFAMFGRSFKIGLFLIDIAALVLFPLALSLVFFLLDLGRGKIGKQSKEKTDAESYEKFIDNIGTTLNQTHKFNVEDYRHFRENKKFQECLRSLYEIYVNGESDNYSYYLLMRKFDKGTKERDAIEFLITFAEQKRKELEEKRKEKVEAQTNTEKNDEL